MSTIFIDDMAITLKDIRSKLINENVDFDTVLKSIRNKNYVRIRYNDSTNTAATGSRVIQPMAVGTTKKGYPVLRAFQIGGDTKRGKPKWKFFRLDRVESWRPMNKKKFNTPPALYNRTGDKSMGTFLDNAKFDELQTTLDKLRAKTKDIKSAPKISTKNSTGPITASQQWKKNAFTSQPHSDWYAQVAKNVRDAQSDNVDRWAAYDQAEKELEKQKMSQEVPLPDRGQAGPLDYDGDEDYDIDEFDDFDESQFMKNNNRRRY